jgi:hypothetical protein
MTINYKGCEIEVVLVTHRIFDVYINGIPRICRNNPEQGLKEAKALIDQGFGPCLKQLL